MKILFCDRNESLVKKVKVLFKEYKDNPWGATLATSCSDVFKHRGVIVTASNPQFDMVGGLDLQLLKKYPEEAVNRREFLQTQHLFYTVTVDSQRKSSRSIVLRALAGTFLVFNNTEETVILTGLGTGVGGLAEDDFIDLLKRVLSADLRFADLRFANLSSADLSSADLSSADLSYADLRYANLRSADLRSANLRSANLRSADLSGANLRSADLRSANLSGANLRSADLSSTPFDGMTVSEFVSNYNLKVKRGKLVMYKGVAGDNKSPVITSGSHQLEYKKGTEVVDKYVNFSVADTCANGIHVCPTEELAKEFGVQVIKVEVDVMDFVAIPGNGSKVRVKKLKVL